MDNLLKLQKKGSGILKKRDLTQTFNEIQRAYPALVAEATPLDMGQWGLVADHNDGTVTKLLFRQDHEKQQDWAEANLSNELAFLRMARGVKLDGIQIPEIVTDIKRLDEGTLFASYRMTKLSGMAANWKAGPRQQQDDHFFEAGHLLARFHEAAAALPVTGLVVHSPEKAGMIETVPALDAARNEALAVADLYLQAHKQGGIIHADYHGGNILLDQKGRISGLIDFAVTGPSANRLIDFINVPPEKSDAFRKGYAQASGQVVDPMMMAMTEISMLANCINFYADRPAEQKKWIGEMDRQLVKIRPVTGFTPG